MKITKKITKLTITAAAILPLLLSMSGGAAALEPSEEDYAVKLLGKYLFFDNISDPSRQACASCHAPRAGWTNGVSGTNLHQVAVTGANPHTVGTLKPPSNAYASFHDNFNPDRVRGGNFWDGRATGDKVADILDLPDEDPYAKYLGPTADQAHASPFINPVEQGMADIVAVCEHVKGEKYAALYPIAYDDDAINCDNVVAAEATHAPVEITFARFALALAAYQHSSEVNAFRSRRDECIDPDHDGVAEGAFPCPNFTDQENLGHDIFYDQTTALNPDPDGDGPLRAARGGCAAFCHRNGTNPDGSNNRDGTAANETYARDRFFNLGIPYNVDIPNSPLPDRGVAATMEDLFGATDVTGQEGEHKVPTLRNVDKRPDDDFIKAYMHNGYFKSLEDVVHFYNTADVKELCDNPYATVKEARARDCWPVPEINTNIAGGFGDLGLSAEEEAAIVAYMKTLTDIPTPKKPVAFNLKKFYRGQLR